MINNWSFGIDLGTTNSCIAMSNGKSTPKLINVPGSMKGILPSCVRFVTRNEYIVGCKAYEHKELPSVVYSSKRLMDKGEEECIDVIADDGEKFKISPVKVGSIILKTLLDAASEYMKTAIDEIVITVPAYFNEHARYNTRLAGIGAGLEESKITLISEPTAAAMSYGINNKKGKEKIAVYDLGGGTFDISLVEIICKDVIPTFKVLATGGNPHLGGDDADTYIAEVLVGSALACITQKDSEFYELTIADLYKTSVDFKRLVHECEKLKKDYEDVTIGIKITGEMFSKNTDEVYIHKTFITKQFINNCVKQSIYNQSYAEMKRVIQKDTNIERILLIGGSTKSSIIIDNLQNDFQVPVKWYTDPDKSVAFGAAIYQSMKDNQNGSHVQDVTQQPLGVAAINEDGIPIMNVLIDQNTPLPAYADKITLRTQEENQKSAVIEVYQGLKRRATENILLGYVEITDIPKKPKGEVMYEVTLTVDLNGILSTDIKEYYTSPGDELMKCQREFHKEIMRMSGANQGNTAVSKENAVLNRRLLKLRNIIEDDKEFEEQAKVLESLKTTKEITEFFNKIESTHKEW